MYGKHEKILNFCVKNHEKGSLVKKNICVPPADNNKNSCTLSLQIFLCVPPSNPPGVNNATPRAPNGNR